MAVISITIPDAVVGRVRDAFATAYGYQAAIPDPANPGSTIPNPESKIQFTQRKIREYVKEVVKGVEVPLAGKTASDQKLAQVESEIILS